LGPICAKIREELTIRDEQSVYIGKAALFLLSAALHALGFYLLIHARFNYKIYRYDKSGIATVVHLPPKQITPFKAPATGALSFKGVEPPIVKPGKTAPGTAVKEEPAAKAAPAEAAGLPGGKPGAPPGPPGPPGGGGEPGPAKAGGEPGAAEAGGASGFSLTYPLGSQLRLSKPPETSIDEILRPGRYKRSNLNLSTTLRPEPGAMAPSGRMGVGRGGGGGGGGGGQGTPGGSVSLKVARYDLVPWATGVMTKIQNNWKLDAPEDAAYKLEVRITVLMAKSGELLAVEMETPSRVESLDKAAMRALQASGPFPPLPVDFPKSSLEMTFVFQYGY